MKGVKCGACRAHCPVFGELKREPAAARGKGLRGQLIEVLTALFDYFHKNRDLTRIAFATAFAAPGDDPDRL